MRLNSDFLGLVLILPTGGLRWGQRAMLPGGVRGEQRCAGEHENEESLARLIQVQLVQVLCGIRHLTSLSLTFLCRETGLSPV